MAKGCGVIKLLLAEDNPDYRETLAAFLESEPDFSVMKTNSGSEAVRLAGLYLPEVAIMDIGLPGLNGIEATRQIHLAYPSIHILVLTVFDDDNSVFEAIKAGAHGYLLKGARVGEIPEAVREVARGHSLIQPSLARKVLDEFQRLASSSKKPAAQENIHLSAREQEVLNALARGKQLAQVADLLGVSPHTIKTYVQRIYEKLEVSSKAEAVMVGIKRGLIDMEGSP